ncbi:hypothetical protein D9758_013132 [Tetrapyrgos nigripes]|uniref:Uncharacterized protein n=1 Tax=Tetrapyrgos nigripes TaxID=182062 RepID=A0A8H5CE66_9AGAR|nr:hypothetical protein D9758_013132 [Tetrapyrgos nigripes]
MFFSATVLSIAVVAATVATAASAKPTPSFKRQDEGNLTSCVMSLTADKDVGNIDFQRELNFVIASSLNIATNTPIFNLGVVITDVEGSTFTVQDDLSVDNFTAAETAAILTGFVSESHPGEGGVIEWTFDSVNCEDATSTSE